MDTQELPPLYSCLFALLANLEFFESHELPFTIREESPRALLYPVRQLIPNSLPTWLGLS
jgi:hypothetical protein